MLRQRRSSFCDQAARALFGVGGGLISALLSSICCQCLETGRQLSGCRRYPFRILDGLKQGSRTEKCAYVCQILWGIDTASGRLLRDVYGNRVAMPECPQLFERLGYFQRRLRQPWK